ncbi:MAG: DEAD/DEAH box helicase [Chromatiales bacterium]|nr:DEAD/DEAH box helicase [Chromatiales bacterium]
MNKLSWTVGDAGLVFQVERPNGVLVPLDSWGRESLLLRDGRKAGVGALLGFTEDGKVEADGMRLPVPHALLATLDSIQSAQLGLPPIAPVRLKIQGRGILASPSFRFQHQLVKLDGTPVLAPKRDGVLLAIGGANHVLLDPLFSLIEGMDAFNAIPPEQIDERFLRWADLKPLLPEDALVDNNLRSMNIVRADAFTLDVDDTANFSPQLLHHLKGGAEESAWEEPGVGVPVLPDGPQRDFEQKFKSIGARRRYKIEGNWFVAVPESVQQALSVVHQIQRGSLAERRAFLANPSAVLRDRLEGRVDDEQIDSIFEETPEFLSQRVTHLGEWEPKINAYKMPSGQIWLPDDDLVFGVLIEGRIYEVPAKDAGGLLAAIKKARANGEQTVEYNGETIPANDEAERVIGGIAEGVRKKPERTSAKSDQPKPRPEVPILLGNLDQLDFQAKPRVIRGERGGFPEVLKTTSLYPHQKDGLIWLQEHWASGSTGALLADDMGLGKTLQTLAFFAWVQEQMDQGDVVRKPLLIVAPTGLLKNWEDEAEQHLAAPGLGRLFRAFGRDLSKLKTMTHNQRKRELQTADWVLTTYETLRDKITYFLPVAWGVVAFDEVQKVKNPTSRMTEMAKSIEAEFFLALTGTPVENALADLWSIVDLIAPGQLGALRDFHNRFVKSDGDEASESIAFLGERLMKDPKPVRLLRRMKDDHLKGLPEKYEHVVKEQMPLAQAAAYDQLIAGIRGEKMEPMAVLKVLQDMRRVSLLPEPIGEEGLTDEIVRSSARLSALIRILDEIHRKNEKALIFLEFLKIQDALIPYLQQRYGMPHPPLRISGSVDGHIRKKHVDTFQSRPRDQFDVMLLSPKAGGVGLTLTAANNVIHLSRWWNPAVEDQCTDRAFRIGQDRPVNVYYPLSVHPRLGDASFDLNLNALLDRKRTLSREVLSPPVAGQAELDELVRASASAG